MPCRLLYVSLLRSGWCAAGDFDDGAKIGQHFVDVSFDGTSATLGTQGLEPEVSLESDLLFPRSGLEKHNQCRLSCVTSYRCTGVLAWHRLHHSWTA